MIFAPTGKYIAQILSTEVDAQTFSNLTLNDSATGDIVIVNYINEAEESESKFGYYLSLSITILGTLLLDFSAGKNLIN